MKKIYYSYKNILKLFDCLDLKYNFDSEVKIPNIYDGKQFNLGFSGYKLSKEELIHELAHWLVASKRYRNYVNFGLGQSDHDANPKYLFSYNSVNFDHRIEAEQKAWALGTSIQKELFYHSNFRQTLNNRKDLYLALRNSWAKNPKTHIVNTKYYELFIRVLGKE